MPVLNEYSRHNEKKSINVTAYVDKKKEKKANSRNENDVLAKKPSQYRKVIILQSKDILKN